MTNLGKLLGLSIAVFVLSACALTPAPHTGGGTVSAQTESYNGPKARIAVIAADEKQAGGLFDELGIDMSELTSGMGGGTGAYNKGMAEMLTTALFQTNRYIVLERQRLSAVLAEQDLATAGRTRREASTPTGEMESAELLVTAKITGFEDGVSGGGGGILSMFGALGGSFKKSHIAMDLRVIDSRTSRIVAVTNVQGSASSYSAEGSFIGGTMGGNLSAFKKTPMETAIRRMIVSAVDFVVSQTPETYYRYSAMGDRIEPERPIDRKERR